MWTWLVLPISAQRLHRLHTEISLSRVHSCRRLMKCTTKLQSNVDDSEDAEQEQHEKVQALKNHGSQCKTAAGARNFDEEGHQACSLPHWRWMHQPEDSVCTGGRGGEDEPPAAEASYGAAAAGPESENCWEGEKGSNKVPVVQNPQGPRAADWPARRNSWVAGYRRCCFRAAAATQKRSTGSRRRGCQKPERIWLKTPSE